MLRHPRHGLRGAGTIQIPSGAVDKPNVENTGLPWRAALTALLAMSQAWASPRVAGVTGPLWFFEAAPGIWRADGGVRLSWENGPDGPALSLQDSGRTLRIRYPGSAAHPHAKLCTGQRAPIRWFTGEGERPHQTSESGECLLIESLWPGISLRLMGGEGRIKSDYIVEPGVSSDVIRVAFDGARAVRVEPGGGLLIEMPDGLWREDPPRAWTETGEPVDVSFRIHQGQEGHSVGFIAPLLNDERLIIDPAINYSGVFGGNGISAATAMTVDSFGSVYVAGYTDASDFPQAAAILPRGGGVDAVVIKLDPATGKLLWANYIGGNGDDRAQAIALSSDGGLVVAGSTNSANFPVAGAASSPRGGTDAFLLKFAADGSQLLFSSYLGGTQNDSAYSVAASATGVWVGGQTSSTNFPVSGAPQTALRGATDGFVARYGLGGAMEYSTYLGGGGDDLVRTLAIAPGGDILAGGSTGSADLPVPPGAAQPSLRGALDGFVLKLSSSGSLILAGTYLGGSAGTASMPERVEALAVDGSLNVYAAGYTPSADFPAPGAWLGTMGGVRDGFLVKLHPGLNGFAWGTYLGGGGQDMIQTMALLPDGRIAVGGATTSVNLPLQDPVVTSYRGSTDGFLTIFTPDGTAVPFSTYIGGAGADTVFAVAPAPGNSVVVAGQSGSPDLPLRGPAPAPSGSALRFFVTRFTLGPAPQIDSITPASGTGEQGVFEVQASHPNGATQFNWVELALGDLLGASLTCRVRWIRSSGQLMVLPEGGATEIPITPGTASSSSGAACTLSGATSTVSVGGTSVSIRLSLSFTKAFAGSRSIAAAARAVDEAESGYVSGGTWIVPDKANTPPDVASATFSTASGVGAVFTVLATDADGAGDLAKVRLLVGTSPVEAGACAVEYDRAAGLLRLVNDSGTGWYSAAPGTAAPLANSHCQLRPAATVISFTANGLQIGFDIIFASSNPLVKSIYASATDASGAQTGYLDFGLFPPMANNNTAPVFVQLTPSAGGGALQRFTITYADSNGASDLVLLRMRFHNVAQDSGACLLELDRRTSTLRLRNDAGSDWLLAAVGSSQTVANSRCEMRPAGVTVAVEGQLVHWSIEIAFFPGFNGARTIWTAGEDASAATSGWQQTGSFSVAVIINMSPVPLSVSPSSGSGTGTTLTAEWTDANGPQDIRTVRVLVNSSQTSLAGCYVAFDRQTLAVSLANDTGSGWSAAAAGSGVALSNSQCTVHTAGSSLLLSGTKLSVSFQFSFKSPFNGAKSVWANATDLSGATSDSPWMGSYTVVVPVNQAPHASSLTPSAGSGSEQVFVFSWIDLNGGADIQRAEVLIHSAQSAAWGCYLQVRPATGSVALAADDGASWSPVQAGAQASASNSQCTLRGSGTSLQILGSTLVARLDLSFKPVFNGAKSLWANALDTAGMLSQTPLMGTYTVAASAQLPPVPVSVSPSTGSGGGQVFQFVWTDANGANDISSARVLINSSQQAPGGCYFVIDRAAGLVTLADDAGSPSQAGRLGTSDVVANSQCALQMQSSSVQATGSTLSAYIDIRFKAKFNGLKAVFMNATDLGGLTSAAPQLGTYDVMSNLPAAPISVSVSPAAASGARQTFTLTWTDANGAHDILWPRVLINSVQQANQACYLQVDIAAGKVMLADDAAALSTSLTLGAAQTVQNSQCRVYGSGSWTIASGNTLTVMLDIAFIPGFTGTKSIWMNATDSAGLTSPSPQTGSYTVTP